MTKIYLHKYASIVLTVVSILLTLGHAYTLYFMYSLSATEVGLFENPQFQFQFVQSALYALIFLALGAFFAVKAFLDKPLLEVRYEDEFVYEEVTEEEEELEDEEDNDSDK